MPETQVYSYLTATLDLSIPAEKGNLLITDHNGELIAEHRAAQPDMSHASSQTNQKTVP